METQIFKISDNLEDEKGIELGAKVIKEGGLVAFPTETVYGLGANALMKEAAKKIYAAKGRPGDNPLIVHISHIKEAEAIAEDIPDIFYILGEKFWPGPLTMVLKKSAIIPHATSGGLDTVAIRLPSNPIARELIKKSGVPIAAPSANTSGRPSPTKASHVFEDMKGKIDIILDGGSVGIGLESTIVDLTETVPTLLRPGAVTLEMLEEVCPKINIDPAIENLLKINQAPKAPGMKYKHYAPKADMEIVSGEEDKVMDYFIKKIHKYNKKLAIILVKEHLDVLKTEIKGKENIKLLNIGGREDMKDIAHNLFDVLRQCDDMEADFILCEAFEETGMGKAIMNRLKKAAGFNIVKV